MNERILELRTQAAAWVSENHQPQNPNAYSQKEIDQRYLMYEEKFAELIVRECAGICDDYGMPDGTSPTAIILSAAIKKRFGIKE